MCNDNLNGVAMNIAIEHVARAFHAVQEDAIAWENEPEILKEEFRNYAREALELFAEYEAQQRKPAMKRMLREDARAAA